MNLWNFTYLALLDIFVLVYALETTTVFFSGSIVTSTVNGQPQYFQTPAVLPHSKAPKFINPLWFIFFIIPPLAGILTLLRARSVSGSPQDGTLPHELDDPSSAIPVELDVSSEGTTNNTSPATTNISPVPQNLAVTEAASPAPLVKAEGSSTFARTYGFKGWGEDLMTQGPRISTRIYLRWPHLDKEKSAEQPDTIIFGVGSYFVQLGINMSDHSIDHIVAGKRETIARDPVRFAWRRILDSIGGSEAQNVHFATKPSGDVVERGARPCPESGMAVKEYEEEWRILGPRSGPEAGFGRAWILESADTAGQRKAFLAMIAGQYIAVSGKQKTSENDKRNLVPEMSEKGKRVERTDRDREFGAVREEWDDRQKRWKSKYKIGSRELPALSEVKGTAFLGEESWTEGARVMILKTEYIVRAFDTVRFKYEVGRTSLVRSGGSRLWS